MQTAGGIVQQQKDVNAPLILIVDDEPTIRDMLAFLLHLAGYQTVTAAHGIEALALIANSTPDLVLSDVMMPVLDGAELCRRLKSAPLTESIPVILMSGLKTSNSKVFGADAFLAKPFSLEEVEGLVSFWLSKSVAKMRLSGT